ncbi:unnamed protein product, partial [Darwinula stevensoni]
MLINLADLLVRFLMVMAELKWESLVRFYLREEIASVDDVIDSEAADSRSSSFSRVSRALERDVAQEPSFDPAWRRKWEKCYHPYGCFSTKHPWTSAQRPLALHPEPPEVIRPVFCLYTRRNPTECYRLKTNETRRLKESPFDRTHPVALLIHGYLDHGRKPWILEMKTELLKLRDLNVVVLSWLGGSGPPYTQAVANSRLVGVMAAHFLAFLSREAGTRIEEVHAVGHSLGSHLASYIGSSAKDMGLGKLGRITGLDPAEPHFEYADPRVRLDPEDALFVDVIHTDGAPLATGGLGLLQPVGHVDFYPNSGTRMPGCDFSLHEALERENGSVVYGLTQFLSCNHLRAVEYFIESINSPCLFLAHQCSNWVEFKWGGCVDCGQRGEKCARMGYHAREAWEPDFYEGESRQLYLFTDQQHPYCRM